jgi:hypothetical protein
MMRALGVQDFQTLDVAMGQFLMQELVDLAQTHLVEI